MKHRRKALAWLAFLVVGCSTGNRSRTPDADGRVEIDCPAQLVVVYDKPGETGTLPIKIRHALGQAAVVKAETGCGCLTIECPSEPVPPDAWFPLNARFVTRPEIARRDVFLSFTSPGARPVQRRVPTVIAMMPYLEVEPRGLLIESTAGASLNVRIRQRGESDIAAPRFLGVPENLRIEKVDLVGRRPSEFGVACMEWIVTIRGQAPTDGSQEADEFYVAGDTNRPPAKVTVTYARPHVVLAVPSRLFFGAVPCQEIANGRSIVRRRDGKPLTVREIRSSNPSFQARILPGTPTAGDSGLMVAIRFRPTHSGSESGTILMRTDAPDSPEVRIAVEGSGE